MCVSPIVRGCLQLYIHKVNQTSPECIAFNLSDPSPIVKGCLQLYIHKVSHTNANGVCDTAGFQNLKKMWLCDCCF